MNVSTRVLIAATTVAILWGHPGKAAAQEPLAEARALYAAAAYEDALSVLGKLDSTAVDRGEAEQYRAFCLIALGRTADAERAIEAVVAADPLFVPRPSDVSPRVVAMFTDVRRRILPEIARRAYLDGRSAFQAKDFAGATRKFDHVMRVLDQAGPESAAVMDDLRILVSGFVDLARAANESPSRPAGDPGTPALPPDAAARTALPPDGFTAPIAIRQELPAWNPPSSAIASREYTGAVKILIGPDGHVQDASLLKPVHPLYDSLVLHAARGWTYRPATRLGEPTTAEKIVEIRLTPR
jgi:tetratricopeptide (TPR) repeat protein